MVVGRIQHVLTLRTGRVIARFSVFMACIAGFAACGDAAPAGAIGEADREQLEAVAYLGVQGRPAPADAEPVRVDKTRAQAGATLYLSAHAPEAYLIDLEGTVLHRWQQPTALADPAGDPSAGALRNNGWRRVQLLRNGDLAVVQESSKPELSGLILLDAASNVRWFCKGLFHHDVEVQPDGTVYALSAERLILPRFDKKKEVQEDYIAIVSAEGVLTRRVSLLKALEQSDFAGVLFQRLKTSGDLFHANDLEVLDGRLADRNPAFRKGNVLVSLRNQSALVVVDLEQQRVVWALSGGMFSEQHEPTLLENGHLLIFDNTGPMQVRGGTYEGSRVIEFDPFTQQIFWQYPGKTGQKFLSRRMGDVQRLPNGNTLVVESEGGRALEITPSLEIVWEFHNPHRATTPDGLSPLLFQAHRLPEDFPLDWCRTP